METQKQDASLDTENYTLAEVAKWLRCSPRTIQRLLETGDGPPTIRLSERRIIFRLSDVRVWLAQRTKGVAENASPARRGRPHKKIITPTQGVEL